jgi:flagellar biosynthetic protein FlhB
MAEPAGEKTEKPTAKRLREARRNGDFLQSRELSTALVVMAGFVWIVMTGPALMTAIRQMLVDGLSFGTQDIESFEPAERAYNLLGTVVGPFGAVVLIAALAAIISPIILGSLHFNPAALKPKFNKLDPLKGAKRIFGPNGLIELGKSILKVLLLGTIGGWILWNRLDQIRMMGKSDLQHAVGELGSIFVLLILALGGSLFILAAIDVPVQIIRRTKRLNMTKQEIKDEHKDSDGNPLIKQAIRQRAVQNLMESMRKNMDGASVVLTNPTHFAIALRYHPGRDAAPIVVARGVDEFAAAIRELAAEKSVPMLQYPELTRALYFTSHVGQPIDERLFMAVATVLAFVFRIENRMASEMDRPHIDLPDALRFDAAGANVVN